MRTSSVIPSSRFHLSPVPQNWRDPSWPEVSVSVVTYNQAHLIGRAIESVLMQRVNFTYEIVVGDDCSTDGTRELLQSFEQKHPGKFRLLLHGHRLPGTPGRANNMNNPMACRGKYTALLDGDDYWTNPDKLQRQYDLLETYPTLTSCFHDTVVREVDATGTQLAPPTLRGQSASGRRSIGFYTHEEFCRERNLKLHTSSFFFRTRCFGEWPADHAGVVAADHYFALLITQRGPAYYDDLPCSVHERQPASLTNSGHYLDEHRLLQRFHDLDLYRRRFPATLITASYSAYAARLAKQLLITALRRGDVQLALRMILRLLREPRGGWAMIIHRLRKLS